MMHEEFIRISKVEVTAKYYKEAIEPLYREMDVEKEAFIEQWLKDNKANIVKAHAFDLDRASRELALNDCKAADLENLKSENKRLQHEAERLENSFKAANSSWKEEKHMAEVWKKDFHEAQKQAEEVEPLKEKINDLENEIIRLKARLFDLMEQGVK